MWECVVRAHPMPNQIIIYAVGEPKRIKCSNDKSILRRYIAPKTWAIHKSDLINQQSLSCLINFLKELSSVCDFCHLRLCCKASTTFCALLNKPLVPYDQWKYIRQNTPLGPDNERTVETQRCNSWSLGMDKLFIPRITEHVITTPSWD